MAADPDVVADRDGQRAHDPFGPLVGQQGVVHGVDTHVGADQHPVADRDGRFVEDREAEVPHEVVADGDALPEVAMERAVQTAVPADPAEKPFQNRFALLAPRGRQGVEREDQFLGPAQGFADGRTDGVEPESRPHLFEFVHFVTGRFG